MTPPPRNNKPKPVIGWREWVALPQLGVGSIKVKVDTGARSSAIHAHHMHVYERDGVQRVRFGIRPKQHDKSVEVEADCVLHEMRHVRSSTGHQQERPVVITPVTLHGETYDIELTLTNRDEMGFRMLLGRAAVRRRFLIDPGRSFLSDDPPHTSKRPKKKRKTKRQTKRQTSPEKASP